MFEKVILGVMAVVVMLVVLLMLQVETNKLKHANEALLQDIRDTRNILEAAAIEIEKLHKECAELQIQLDEASHFISKLRAEIIAQSFERNQSEERDL